jgi:hypothetical protein
MAGGTTYCGEAIPERRAAVTRPGMNAHTASQPDTTNARSPAYPGEADAPPRRRRRPRSSTPGRARRSANVCREWHRGC